MNYDKYNDFAEKIHHHRFLLKFIRFLNSVFTAVGYMMYPGLLIWLFYSGSFRKMLVCLIVPALAFLAVSVFRKKYNAPRPYELYPIKPLIKRDKTGDSFPSRHIFSIFLIGGLWFIFSPAAGMIIFICGLGLAVIRVIGGVHFIKDVVCGALLGIGAAFIVWIIL